MGPLQAKALAIELKKSATDASRADLASLADAMGQIERHVDALKNVCDAFMPAYGLPRSGDLVADANAIVSDLLGDGPIPQQDEGDDE